MVKIQQLADAGYYVVIIPHPWNKGSPGVMHCKHLAHLGHRQFWPKAVRPYKSLPDTGIQLEIVDDKTAH